MISCCLCGDGQFEIILVELHGFGNWQPVCLSCHEELLDCAQALAYQEEGKSYGDS